jgi:hypothetical protein
MGGQKPSSQLIRLVQWELAVEVQNPAQNPSNILSCETSTQKPTALLGACALDVEKKTFGGSHSCSD